MVADRFLLDRYIIKHKFPRKFIVFSDSGKPLFQALRPLIRKAIFIYNHNVTGLPLLTVRWSLKKSLATLRYNYTIIDRSRSPLAYIECERSPVFASAFSIKDIYNKEIGVVQPDQIGYVCKYINIIVQSKKAAVFYRNARMSASYVLDLREADKVTLDRRLALSVVLILFTQGVSLQKFTGPIDWDQSVVTGDEMYKIKRRRETK